MPSSAATTDHQAAAAVDVILRDGSTLRLRAPMRGDAGALAEFFNGLSERSFYLRFHGVRAVDDELIRHFLDPDWNDRGVLVGELDDRIVAVAEYMRLRDADAAEAAFAVADELQGLGIGTRLLERLAALAAGQGIERFVAEVMPENRAMLGVFEGAGLEVTRELDGGEFEVRFPIAPTELYRERVDERDHLAVTA
ncbi:MAG TPA: GNAT family N-acetyltransferase, partial [Gaiellaceae bacterium]|nr:GNAT family N-acetyltransferase [Gaiellaceae bacterium]